MKPIDRDKPMPLDMYLRGRLTLVLALGGVWERDATASTATRLRQIVSDERSPDDPDWDDDWLTIEPTQIAALQWVGHDDYGVSLTADQRQTQAEAGHPNGHLASLVEHWRGRREPAYSINAMVALHHIAAVAGGEEYTQFADVYEGDAGAALAARALADAQTAGPASDTLEEHAPSTPESDSDDESG